MGEGGGTLWLGGSLGFELRVAKSHAAVMWADTGEAFVPEGQSKPWPVLGLHSGICLTTEEQARYKPQSGWLNSAEHDVVTFAILRAAYSGLQTSSHLYFVLQATWNTLPVVSKDRFISAANAGLPALWLAGGMTSQRWGERLPVSLQVSASGGPYPVAQKGPFRSWRVVPTSCRLSLVLRFWILIVNVVENTYWWGIGLGDKEVRSNINNRLCNMS